MKVVYLIVFSVSWLYILRIVWNRSSNNSNFSYFPSMVGIVVIWDCDKLENCLLLLLKLAELLLLTYCWTANKLWSASIVAGIFPLRNCGWLVERLRLFLRKNPGEHLGITSWLLSPCEECHLCLSWLTGGNNRRRTLVQHEDNFGNDHRLVSGFSKLLFRDVPGIVEACDRTGEFKRGLSLLGRAPMMRDCPAEILGQFFSHAAFNILRDLGYVVLIDFSERRCFLTRRP